MATGQTTTEIGPIAIYWFFSRRRPSAKIVLDLLYRLIRVFVHLRRVGLLGVIIMQKFVENGTVVSLIIITRSSQS